MIVHIDVMRNPACQQLNGEVLLAPDLYSAVLALEA